MVCTACLFQVWCARCEPCQLRHRLRPRQRSTSAEAHRTRAEAPCSSLSGLVSPSRRPSPWTRALLPYPVSTVCVYVRAWYSLSAEDQCCYNDVVTDTGKVRGEASGGPSPNANTKSPTLNTSVGNSINNGNPMGLGGLFAGGMPKLKPTGMRSNLKNERDNGNGPTTNLGSATLPSVKRGPPPVPPPAAQKPQLFSPSSQSTESVNSNQNAETPRTSFGKPTLAPKPPNMSSGVAQQKPSPPPKKLNLSTGNSVSR